jgi:sugar lactone lactonase YvrE
LYGCQNGRKRIVAFTLDGKVETLAENVESNDLVVNAAGDLYFTDPGNKQVWFLPKGGKPRVVANGLSPNGLTLWPDQGTLVVTERDQPLLWTFRVEADGSLTAKDSYYAPLQMATGKTRPGSDGLKVDAAGRVYTATYAGLQVFDEFGRLIGTILKPQAGSLSNVCFGGPNLDTLYVTAGDKVFKRKVKVKGMRYVPVIVEKK